MNCPLCNIALKVAEHRGLDVKYCPLCGGTWLNQHGLASIPLNTGTQRRRRLLRITILVAILLLGSMIVTVSVGAVKLWPTIRSWTEATVSEIEKGLASQVRQLAGRLGDQRVLELSRGGVDSAVLSALMANAGFERLLNSVTAVPNLGPLVQDGAYLTVLQEAARQNVQNLADLTTDRIASPEIRAATERIQQALRLAPGGGRAAGIVDPAVLAVLRSDTFQELSRRAP